MASFQIRASFPASEIRAAVDEGERVLSDLFGQPSRAHLCGCKCQPKDRTFVWVICALAPLLKQPPCGGVGVQTLAQEIAPVIPNI
jgi:hypothetical protein